MIKKEFLTLSKDDFKDDVHLNGAGADKFTRCFVEIMEESFYQPFYEAYEQVSVAQ